MRCSLTEVKNAVKKILYRIHHAGNRKKTDNRKNIIPGRVTWAYDLITSRLKNPAEQYDKTTLTVTITTYRQTDRKK